MNRESQGKTISQLLDEFAAARQENLAKLDAQNLSAADLQRTGIHPRFGQVTLQQLLATWVAHDLNHIHQIAKCMAWQYADEIGLGGSTSRLSIGNIGIRREQETLEGSFGGSPPNWARANSRV